MSRCFASLGMIMITTLSRVLAIAVGIMLAMGGFQGKGLAKEPVPVAFYASQRCLALPTLDGKLNDNCWQNLPSMEHFYQYWSPIAKPPPLKTSAKLCWDDGGLYIGITLYDEHVDKIRATISDRDNPITWTDDCVEIMIDPDNTGTSYYKFVTNFLCARYDEKVTNMVIDADWNAEGWRVRTSKGEVAWFIEFFLPWNDIGAKPKEGEIWSFDLVRYGYSTGSFRGVTWSLGGSYADPQNFGYLFFGQFTPAQEQLKRLAKLVTKTKGNHFWLAFSDSVLTYHPDGRWVQQSLRSWVEEAINAIEIQQAFVNIKKAVSAIPEEQERKRIKDKVVELEAKFQELQTKFQRAQPLPVAVASNLREEAISLHKQADELKWEGLLLSLVYEGW